MSEHGKVRKGTKSILMPVSEFAELADCSLSTARGMPIKKVQVGRRFKFVRSEAEKYLNGETK